MRRTRLRDHSINRLIPNMLTLFALCAGLTSIKFALDANALMNVTAYTDQTAVADAAARKWELACIAIIVAAVFDALDGRIARLLDSTSKFGAELDSLSDFIAFGVAPSVILYVWTMDQAGRIGWGLTLLFSACMALRLARFNTNIGIVDKRYFQGLPCPSAAAVMVGLIWVLSDYGLTPDRWYIIAGITWGTAVFMGMTMVSNVPFYSFKEVNWRQRVPLWVILAGVLARDYTVQGWFFRSYPTAPVPLRPATKSSNPGVQNVFWTSTATRATRGSSSAAGRRTTSSASRESPSTAISRGSRSSGR